jgi:hypothetical protein
MQEVKPRRAKHNVFIQHLPEVHTMKHLMILLVAAALASPLAAEPAPRRTWGKGLLAAAVPKKKDEKKPETKKAETKKDETKKDEPAAPAEKAAEPKKTERQSEYDRELAKRLADRKAAGGGKELSYKEKAAIRQALLAENAKKRK